MTSKPGLGKNPKLSHPPSTSLVYESHEYGSRDHLGHPPDPRLPADLAKCPCGLATHFPNARHSCRGGLTVFQVLSNGSSSALGRESTEGSRLPLNAHSALSKSTLEPRDVTGGPLRGESGGSLFEILSEAHGGRADTDRDTEHSQDQPSRDHHRRPHARYPSKVRGPYAAISACTRWSAWAGSDAAITERPITR